MEINVYTGRSNGPVDTTYDVVAPENVAFQYRLAGPFTRAAAWLLDFTITSVWFFVSTICASIMLLYTSVKWELFPEDVAMAFFYVFLLFNSLFCLWFWNATFEAFCRGRTPGKAAFGLRTVSVSGRPIGMGQAFLRNILRLADLMLGPFVVLIMGSNDRMARLGDLASGTIVVNERLQKKATPSIVFHETNIVTIESRLPDDLIVSKRIHQALSLYVARRLQISPPRRYEIAAPLAGILARQAKFPYRVDPDAFLCALWQRVTGNANEKGQESRL